MQIGKLRELRRQTKIFPSYYDTVTAKQVNGRIFHIQIAPFDGEVFLPRSWSMQCDWLWLGRGEPALKAAVVGAVRACGREPTQHSGRKEALEQQWFAEFLDKGIRKVNLKHEIGAEGKWISQRSKLTEHVITVLETTRVRIRFASEEHIMLLQPGTVAMISPITLARNINASISFDSYFFLGDATEIEDEIKQVFSPSLTAADIVKLLQLKPAKLLEQLVVKRADALPTLIA